MNISLKGVMLGEWRDLTDDELIALFRLLEHSSSDAKPAKKAQAKTVAAKKPGANRPKSTEKAGGHSASRKRFTQPGRKKKGR